jgi:hypothetical protein
MLTAEEFQRALEHAWASVLPGREAATRDAMLKDLQRLLEAHARETRPRAPIRLRLVRD